MNDTWDIHGAASLSDTGVFGYVYNVRRLECRFVVELLADGIPVSLSRADAFAPELCHVGDSCYGYGFSLPQILVGDNCTLEVKIANTGYSVGEPMHVGVTDTAKWVSGGRVAWVGGLRLSGWITDMPGASLAVRAIVDGRIVADTPPTSWTYAQRGTIVTAEPAFDIYLPPSFADGRVHRVEILDQNGDALSGSPCHVLAVSDAAREALLDGENGNIGSSLLSVVDRVVPRSVPFVEWPKWRYRHPPVKNKDLTGTVLIILVGGDATETLASLPAKDDVDWVVAHLSSEGDPGTFDRHSIDFESDDFAGISVVVFALGGTVFTDNALEKYASAVLASASTTLAYADVEIRSEDQVWPILWPAYDLQRQLEQGYGALAFAIPFETARMALKDGADSLPAVFLAAAECPQMADAAPVHIPDVLITLPSFDPVALSRPLARAARRFMSRSGIDAEVLERPGSLLPSIHIVRRIENATLSVVVVAPDYRPEIETLNLIRACVEDSAQELIVAFHRSREVGSIWDALEVPGDRNPSRLRNVAMHRASSDYILFLDAGIYPHTASCVRELLSRIVYPSVSAVGGVELGPEGVIVQAGSVLGVEFGAAPAFAGTKAGSPGYSDSLHVARSCGACDASCLLVRRTDLIKIDGFDEVRFPDRFSGIDMSLRLRAAGHQLVFTPDAVFRRTEAPMRPRSDASEAELVTFRNRWGPELLKDPYYHPALNLDHRPFTGLAWPPRSRLPRRNDQSITSPSPYGF